MAQDRAPRPGHPVALSELFDTVLGQLEQTTGQTSSPAADGFLYSGNRHESVPRGLFLDRRLTPLERNAWQVFRLLLNDDGVTALPTYEQLRPWLTAMPCGPQASHETVARALTLLRLTRWLSLVRRRRDPKSGRIQGNLYVLHDEPLTPFEAMQLDPDYLGLVNHALSHAAKAVQVVGLHTLTELADDPLLAGRSLPTRLQVLARRLELQGRLGATYPQSGRDHDSEDGANGQPHPPGQPSSDGEVGTRANANASLRHPKTGRTVRSESIQEIRTVPRVSPGPGLRLPERFTRLTQAQQAAAMVALQPVEAALRQAVLDEWAARCAGQAVRNPTSYLFGLIQRAIHGEFNPWIVEGKPSRTPLPASAPAVAPTPKPVASPEIVKLHLARLRELINRR
ncbi:Uncharacterised protein [Delftia tsuruhatensis]|uniref:STY4528 family pathogenicity island replication protein n=1 Tax=Delftia tsuruhatensis TaxID=180282 RepID=UPI001E7E815A|nr:STY4528 family pathogenicity island replication protein [Delftia tsuruhatensis]CAB5670080.1 Uncharacterised protein [Delftia tsuruhatensis]CAC9682938.1 Uncharacterised protein [Delftia tsuruhatensis]